MLNAREAARLLEGWDDILILCHISPDGDTLGSAAGLARGLKSLGKRAWVRCADPIPKKFAYLFEGIEEAAGDPQHIVAVDVATAKMLGADQEKLAGRVDLAIDHHGSHQTFSAEEWVEPDSAATVEMIYLLLRELDALIDPKTADCLYTGLSTDTGCFRYRNVTPRTHQIAARLLELGADGGGINQRVFETKSRAQVEAERLVLESMEFFCGGRCALVRAPLSLLKETGASEEDVEGVTSLPRQIEGVLVGITMKEKPGGLIKASVRTNPPADASRLCGVFGGGGHPGAAGCSFEGMDMDRACEAMIKACEEYLGE